jgi:diguanylate cyclase (GGDEF)-like protein
LHLDRDRLRAIELAHQDPLTGLGNRRLLIQEHETMRLRFHRDGVPVYLILLDVDHFKTINDRFGHDAGDQVICELASLLRRVSRGDDVAVRLGGEEFALLLCADSDSVAWHIAERIRTLFANTPSRYGADQVIPHTLSAGVARVMSQGRELGYREMVALADEALYRAKAAGRNRTLFANPVDPLPGGGDAPA